MSQKKLNVGSACILVRDQDLLNAEKSRIYKWLRSAGYQSWGCKGWYDGVDWIFININSKTYAPGMPGMKLAEVLGAHAITFDEFLQIYDIYKKYESLGLMYMSHEEKESREKEYAEREAALEMYWANTTFEQYQETLVKELVEAYHFAAEDARSHIAAEKEYVRQMYDSKRTPASTAGELDLMW